MVLCLPKDQHNHKSSSTVWAKSLVGLSMKVPGYWWDGCNTYKLHDGTIDSFDVVNRIPVISVLARIKKIKINENLVVKENEG
jgi:hypothetical protein